MIHRSGGTQRNPARCSFRSGFSIGFLGILAAGLVVFGPVAGSGIAHAAVCAQCHNDGRTGTPPATPTHIAMGLVAAPTSSTPAAGSATTGAAATAPTAAPKAAPAAPAGTATSGAASPAAAPKASAPSSAPAKAAGTATAPRARASAPSNAGVCAQCHSDGRSGMTPPGHVAISGMMGSGTAAKTATATGRGGATAVGPGGKMRARGPHRPGKLNRNTENQEQGERSEQESD